MNGIGEYLDVHSTALEVRARRNKILASNIANAATPHFKARDIDFQDEIRRAAGSIFVDNIHIKISFVARLGLKAIA